MFFEQVIARRVSSLSSRTFCFRADLINLYHFDDLLLVCRVATSVLLLVDSQLFPDRKVDALEHQEPEDVHGKQSGKENQGHVDEGVELDPVFRVTALLKIPNYHGKGE